MQSKFALGVIYSTMNSLIHLPNKITIFILILVMLSTSSSSMNQIKDSAVGQEKPIDNENAPVIGVITQVLRDYKKFVSYKALHLPSSYVKWIENSGAFVLPILLNQDDDYYKQVFNQTNGLLLPGGDNLLKPEIKTPMMETAKILYKLAIEANDKGDYYPIWGTCLGFELLSVLVEGKNILSQCQSHDCSINIQGKEKGYMFSNNAAEYPLAKEHFDYPGEIYKAMQDNNLTYNYHSKCLIDDDAYKKTKTSKFFKTLAYSKDKNGLDFIAIFEGIDYPFYGVQFHPEKVSYELMLRHNKFVNHSRLSIEVSRYFADLFVKLAKKSNHKPGDNIRNLLIYNYNPLYTGRENNDLYSQRYIFPFTSLKDRSEIEFDTDFE